MHIVRVATGDGPRFGSREDTHIRWFGRAMSPASLFEMTEEELREQSAGSAEFVSSVGVRLLTPVPWPSKIVCVGLNYRDHADESGQAPPKTPLLFAKFPSAVIGPGEPISWPTGLTDQVDWEGELAVVVGAPLQGGTSEDCARAIFGYTAANDVSARDLQFGDGQWVRGKSLDSFCPLGPEIVTGEEFGDPQTKRLQTFVNGVCMQDGLTSNMIFPVADLLSWISGQISLGPGDLVLTGTPPGVGAFRTPPVFLVAGDVVEVRIDGIASLRSPVVGGR